MVIVVLYIYIYIYFKIRLNIPLLWIFPFLACAYVGRGPPFVLIIFVYTHYTYRLGAPATRRPLLRKNGKIKRKEMGTMSFVCTIESKIIKFNALHKWHTEIKVAPSFQFKLIAPDSGHLIILSLYIS